MLKNASENRNGELTMHARCIVQAWYSTTFSSGTHEIVHDALMQINLSDLHHDVAKIIGHWQSCDQIIPLEIARNSWTARLNHESSRISQFRRCQDRKAMAKYEISGDCCLQGEPVSSNLLMFETPRGTMPLSTTESVFSVMNAIRLVQLMEEKSFDIMTALESELLTVTNELIAHVTEKSLDVSFVCSRVEECIELVSKLEPKTMSWSNIMDYMPLKEFHELARRCSVFHKTTHNAYTMNWISRVYGTSILDFEGQHNRERRAFYLKQAYVQQQQMWQIFKFDRYLNFPPRENPMNVIGTLLECGLNETWIEYFKETSGKIDLMFDWEESCLRCKLSSTGASTIQLNWIYE